MDYENCILLDSEFYIVPMSMLVIMIYSCINGIMEIIGYYDTNKKLGSDPYIISVALHEDLLLMCKVSFKL